MKKRTEKSRKTLRPSPNEAVGIICADTESIFLGISQDSETLMMFAGLLKS